MEYRRENDALGTSEIDRRVYWGIHTQRASENFPISNLKVNEGLIRSLAMVKKAACQTNQELQFLSAEKADAIRSACDEVIEGKLADQFPLDALQGGAGTSTNMNINEVLANRAIEILGGVKGDYAKVHPIEDVNKHQSTNDVYPTALKIAAIDALRKMSAQIEKLQGAFQDKEKKFADIVTVSRTELQEAVPMTLGAEFGAYAEAIGRDRWRTFKSEERLRVVNIGGTAVGTGLGTPQSYIFRVIEKLREITGLGISRGENAVDQTANTDVFVEVSGILKAHASNLMKIANDLRLLSMTGEIKLPQLQTGSSIMPGKVNPVILEAVIQVGIKAMANDFIIAETTSRSTLQINEFMPILSHALLESIEILSNINGIFAAYVEGINAQSEKCLWYAENSHAIVTAFLPYIGYERAEELLKQFIQSEESNLKKFLAGHLGMDLVGKVLSPAALTSMGYRDHG